MFKRYLHLRNIKPIHSEILNQCSSPSLKVYDKSTVRLQIHENEYLPMLIKYYEKPFATCTFSQFDQTMLERKTWLFCSSHE